MAAKNVKRPSFGLALITLIIVALIISYGVISPDRNSFGFGLGMDAHIPIACAAIFAALVGRIALGVKWGDMEKSAVNSISQAMVALLIIGLIGMLVGSWVLAGVVPGLIYYGFNLLSPGIFLTATLLLSSIVAIATGSSWGVGATVGVAVIGIAHGLGIPAPVTAGVVISGAYFGDKMSPLSDTTNLAPAVAGSNLFDHIRAMCWTTVPSYLIVIVITIALGIHYSGGGSLDTEKIRAFQEILAHEFTISPIYTAIPPLIVLALSLAKQPAIPGMLAGTFAGTIIALFQGNSLGDALGALHYSYESSFAQELADAGVEGIAPLLAKAGITDLSAQTAHDVAGMICELVNRGGLDSMMWSLSMIMTALILGGIMEECHYLEAVLNPLLYKVKRVGDFVTLVVVSCFLSNLFLGDQFLGIIVPGRMFNKAVARTDLSPRVLSRTLEDCGTLTAVLIPWTGCGAFQSAAMGVPTLDYVPYCFLNYINPFMSIALSYLGFGIYWGKDGADKVEKRTALTFPQDEVAA
ncbi:MAG: Na+/H+ antiporter NhaC [Synergistes sp.]|nr:Na+/H+ antiporter NhaC [Synergistes sp.]